MSGLQVGAVFRRALARRDEMPRAPPPDTTAFLSAQPVLCVAQSDRPQGQPEPCAPTPTLWQVLSPTQPGKWFHRNGKGLPSNGCICRATFGTLRQVFSLLLPLLMGIAGISSADGKTEPLAWRGQRCLTVLPQPSHVVTGLLLCRPLFSLLASCSAGRSSLARLVL